MMTFGNICLLFHCVRPRQSSFAPEARDELFIYQKDYENLFLELKDMGYCFELPNSITTHQSNICSVTFDDGYANNLLFLDIAKKFSIPFIIFINSYNVKNQVPFIWDLHEKLKLAPPDTAGIPYRELYQKLTSEDKATLLTEAHRPLSQEDLSALSKNPLVHFGLHTHHHQLLTRRFLNELQDEIYNNIAFLSQFNNSLLKDLSLPCGQFDKRSLKELKKYVDRVYTIEGGAVTAGEYVMNRITLINPAIGGPLMEQIRRSFRMKAKIRRQFPFLLSLRNNLRNYLR